MRANRVGIGDLVAVKMQDRQDRAIDSRIQKLVGVPGGRERAGLGFPVADDAGNREAGIVESGTEGMERA